MVQPMAVGMEGLGCQTGHMYVFNLVARHFIGVEYVKVLDSFMK